MSDFINAADQDDFLNPDNWGLDDADWALMQQHAAQDWATGPFLSQQLATPHWSTMSGFTSEAPPEETALLLNIGTPSKSDSLPAKASPHTLAKEKESRKSLHLKCPHIGCTHNGTFARRYELDRHTRVKHESKKPFRCPFPGCFNRTKITAYARPDKLTSHIRNVHSRQTDKLLDCCIDGCIMARLPIDLLGVHIEQSHCEKSQSYSRDFNERARAIRNAAATVWSPCPLRPCAKILHLSLLMEHLETHESAQLLEANEFLQLKGYRTSCGYNGDGSSSIIHVQVECPICLQAFDTHKALWQHIDEEYIVAKEHKEHYRSWKRHVEPCMASRSDHSWPWRSWQLVSKNLDQNTACPSCGHLDNGLDNGLDAGIYWYMSDHQKSMLADPETLMPYRRAILKLYPEFATHPVWKDLA